MKLSRDQGLRWPDIHWVLDADHRSRRGRSGAGSIADDAQIHRGGEVACSARVATIQCYNQSHGGIPGNFVGCDQRTLVYRLNRLTGRDPGVFSVGVLEVSGRSAVSPAIRVRARSRDVSVARAACASTEKTMVIASPALLASPTESVVITAVPTAIEGARAVAGDNNENEFFYQSEGRKVMPLYHGMMVRGVLEKSEANQNPAPADCCSTLVDRREIIEVAAVDAVVDENG